MKKLIFVTICAILVILTSCGSGGDNNVVNPDGNQNNNNQNNNNNNSSYDEAETDNLVNYIGDQQAIYLNEIDTQWDRELMTNANDTFRIAEPSQVNAYRLLVIEHTTDTVSALSDRIFNVRRSANINPAKLQTALDDFKQYALTGVTEHFDMSHSNVRFVDNFKAEMLTEITDHLSMSIDTLSIESIL